jgi:hypothetical protein
MELHKPVTHSVEDHIITHLCTRACDDRGELVGLQLPPFHIQKLDVHAQRGNRML